MKNITLLPADSYVVYNKTILTEVDKNTLISLYQPIIGPLAVSLYLTLWRDLDKSSYISKDYNHHHLMTILKENLNNIKKSREILESVGLIKTFYKEGNINNYIYELYSPLSAYEFFNHPILNVVLYNNIGKLEYDNLKKIYENINVNTKDFVDISHCLDEIFSSSSIIETNNKDIININKSKINIKNGLDFDLIKESLPKGILNDRTFNKKTRELINNLAFIYNLDSLKMSELIRTVVNENGIINKEHLRKCARNYYQYNNSSALPTLIYRKQPEYLKTPAGDESKRGKILYVFENTSPYDFLKNKYRGVSPTSRDKKLLETLVIDLELKPAVVNVLIDYVLKINNNKLSSSYVETIAGQWKRMGIETASKAMEVAEKEHKKINKKLNTKKVINKKPVWFDSEIEKEEATNEEIEEMEELLKEFR